jgi:hypothetical protein
MLKVARRAVGAAIACLALTDAAAAPTFRILYHEAIHLDTRAAAGHTQGLAFDAYGRRFNLLLEPNEGIRRAVPRGRTDIEPLKGTLEGVTGSWVRMTRTRSGWRGMVSDGHELYAIEPASEVAGAVVQPLGVTPNSTPVMYRLADALLPLSGAYCEVVNAKGVVGADGVLADAAALPSSPVPQGRITAKMLFDAIAADVASQSGGPSLKLIVGVVADYEFFQQFSNDPEGTIISRMDIVDGIWSSQVGVKISLAPLTVIQVADEPFTKTVPADLLAQVRKYRSGQPAQMATGVTHLMTGRDLDGDVVGISYQDAVCDGDAADSLSEGSHSTLMSALIAAHELGHNFNAPHDGVPGVCSTTPQTFLMAPQINFSTQFSDCSLQQIRARIQTAQCLIPYEAPDVAVELPATLIGASAESVFKLVFMAHAIGDDPSNDVSAIASLPAGLSLQSASATGGGTCTTDGTSVTCTLGTLAPDESREIDLSLAGTAGSYSMPLAVASSNDNVVGNNSGQVAIQISPADPAVAAASGSAGAVGGGSGGGGVVDFWVLGVLGGVVGAGVRRRFSIRRTERVKRGATGNPGAPRQAGGPCAGLTGAAFVYLASWNSGDGTQPSLPSSSLTFHQILSFSPVG